MMRLHKLPRAVAAAQACLAIGSLMMGVKDAYAGLISTVNLDAPTQLDILWRWNPEVPDTDTPTLTNWFATVDISEPSSDEWRLQALFRHVTDPHPELGESSGGQTYYVGLPPYDYADINGFGVLFDDSKLYAYHSPLNRVHTDVFHFTVDRSTSPADTQIRLIGTHVPELLPEPSSLSLVGVAMSVLLIHVGTRGRRTRSRVPPTGSER